MKMKIIVCSSLSTFAVVFTDVNETYKNSSSIKV